MRDNLRLLSCDSMCELTPSVLAHIGSFLTDSQDIQSCLQTSRMLNTSCCSLSDHHIVFFDGAAPRIHEKMTDMFRGLAAIRRIKPRLRCLELVFEDFVDPTIVPAIRDHHDAHDDLRFITNGIKIEASFYGCIAEAITRIFEHISSFHLDVAYLNLSADIVVASGFASRLRAQHVQLDVASSNAPAVCDDVDLMQRVQKLGITIPHPSTPTRFTLQHLSDAVSHVSLFTNNLFNVHAIELRRVTHLILGHKCTWYANHGTPSICHLIYAESLLAPMALKHVEIAATPIGIFNECLFANSMFVALVDVLSRNSATLTLRVDFRTSPVIIHLIQSRTVILADVHLAFDDEEGFLIACAIRSYIAKTTARPNIVLDRSYTFLPSKGLLPTDSPSCADVWNAMDPFLQITWFFLKHAASSIPCDVL